LFTSTVRVPAATTVRLVEGECDLMTPTVAP
jgi:hypothetical protein